MDVNFKWSVGNVVKVPFFGGSLVETTVLERRFVEDEDGFVIEYKTDLLKDGAIFTQEEIETHNQWTFGLKTVFDIIKESTIRKDSL